MGEFGIATRVAQPEEGLPSLAGAAPPPPEASRSRPLPPLPRPSLRAASRPAARGGAGGDDGLPARVSARRADDGPPEERAGARHADRRRQDDPDHVGELRHRTLARVRHPRRRRKRLPPPRRARAGGRRVWSSWISARRTAPRSTGGASRAQELDDGDRITIGGTELVFGRSHPDVTLRSTPTRPCSGSRSPSSCSSTSSSGSSCARRRAGSASAPQETIVLSARRRTSCAALRPASRRRVARARAAEPGAAGGDRDRAEGADAPRARRREHDPPRRRRLVSSRHATIEAATDGLWVEDVGVDQRHVRQRRARDDRAAPPAGRRRPDRTDRPAGRGMRTSGARAGSPTRAGGGRRTRTRSSASRRSSRSPTAWAARRRARSRRGSRRPRSRSGAADAHGEEALAAPYGRRTPGSTGARSTIRPRRAWGRP